METKKKAGASTAKKKSAVKSGLQIIRDLMTKAAAKLKAKDKKGAIALYKQVVAKRAEFPRKAFRATQALRKLGVEVNGKPVKVVAKAAKTKTGGARAAVATKAKAKRATKLKIAATKRPAAKTVAPKQDAAEKSPATERVAAAA